MAKFVLKDASITVDGTDLSDHCSSVTIEDTAEEVEFTSFQNDYREFGQGLKDVTITANFFQDFAATEVDAVLNPLYTAGTPFNVVVRADSAAVGPTNPSYTLSARMFSYSPIAGAVGEASTTEVAFRNAGTAGLTRATA